jgi:flagellar assembly protein FliH
MATVISSDSVEKHNVNKYNFKVIALGGTADESEQQESQYNEENNPKRRSSDIDSSALNTKSKDSLIESLMKKTDEMSSNFIKLQMRLEAKEEEFKNELKKAKEEAFAEGVAAGKAEASQEIEKNLNEKLQLYTNSIEKLEKSAGEFEHALESLKNELVNAAVDIAKEVIKVELSKNSSQVALLLSEELIADLQGASKVTLKVSPKDHAAVVEHLDQLEHVTVLADRAVSEGGVIVISDAGNIDAQIEKRFERVKKAALSE